MQKVLLIDVMSEAFRAFHALPKTIVIEDGSPINALVGFHNAVKKLLAVLRPTHIAAAWSCEGPTFRHEIFADYKGHRSIPADLKHQKSLIRGYLNAIKVTQFSYEKFEADDILATLATHFARKGYEVIIDTVDKDLWSLASDKIKIWMPTTKALIGPESVREKYQVLPSQLIDFLVLTGDKVDGIPAVPGFSARKAVSFLSNYGSIFSVLGEESREVSVEDRDRINGSRELIERNVRIATLCTNLPLNIREQELSTAWLAASIIQATEYLRMKDIGFLKDNADTLPKIESATQGDLDFS